MCIQGRGLVERSKRRHLSRWLQVTDWRQEGTVSHAPCTMHHEHSNFCLKRNHRYRMPGDVWRVFCVTHVRPLCYRSAITKPLCREGTTHADGLFLECTVQRYTIEHKHNTVLLRILYVKGLVIRITWTRGAAPSGDRGLRVPPAFLS